MLSFETDNAAALLQEFKTAIDEKRIVTWSYDNEGDFTHTPDQWVRRAWMRPEATDDALNFYYLGNSAIVTTKVDYAVYHGRLSESLLSHFDLSFSQITTSALPRNGDCITTAEMVQKA